MLISYLHSNNLRELSHTHTHTLQSMLDKEPQSQSLSLWVQETALWARELSVSCKEVSREQGGSRSGEVLSPAGQSFKQLMPREIGVAWSSTLVCGARLSQQWSGACLSYTLKVVCSTLLGLSDKCLDTPDARCGISPGAYLWVVPLCRHGYYDHVCRYLRCVSLPHVSM